jgi:exonuclease V
MPYLPPAQRPAVITSDRGNAIAVDKVKVEDKDRILKRGEVGAADSHRCTGSSSADVPQKIHKRLEREIHPAEIVVTATTREDVWGLRWAERA